MKKLYVPSNVPLEKELMKGFPVKAGYRTALVAIVSTALAALAYMLLGDNYVVHCAGFVLVAVFLSITMQSKIETNLSMVDYLGLMLKFSRNQQKFKYKKEEENLWFPKGEKSPSKSKRRKTLST